MFSILGLLDSPWQKRLNCLSYSNAGADRRLHSSVLRRGRYILQLIKRLCTVDELFSRFSFKIFSKAHNKMMIHNH